VSSRENRGLVRASAAVLLLLHCLAHAGAAANASCPAFLALPVSRRAGSLEARTQLHAAIARGDASLLSLLQSERKAKPVKRAAVVPSREGEEQLARELAELPTPIPDDPVERVRFCDLLREQDPARLDRLLKLHGSHLLISGAVQAEIEAALDKCEKEHALELARARRKAVASTSTASCESIILHLPYAHGTTGYPICCRAAAHCRQRGGLYRTWVTMAA
jgi:hypothetical protein